MTINKELKDTFGRVAKLYDRARIGYPKKLIQDIISASEIRKEDKILDIGCGSGQSTILFGEKDYNILGLDIGKDLIEIARGKAQNLPNVKFESISFEETKLEDNSFNLVISAQAWHWLDEKVVYKKAHRILRAGGYLAIFWKAQDYTQSKFVTEVRELYKKHCPNIKDPMRKRALEAELPGSGLFEDFTKKTYTKKVGYTKKEYRDFVSTLSWIISLTEDQKKGFFLEFDALLEKQEENFTVPYIYTLVMSKKK